MFRRILTLAAAGALIACSQTTFYGEFRDDAFHTVQPARAFPSDEVVPGYDIIYTDPAKRRLLPDDWRVVSHTFERGVPAAPITTGDNTVDVDWQLADGTPIHGRIARYDLRFLHTSSNGLVGFRVLPLESAHAARPSAVVAEDWVNALSGTVQEPGFAKWTTVSRRMATKILGSRPLSLPSGAAHEVTFEAVDLDQLQMNPDAPRLRGRAVVFDARINKALLSNPWARAIGGRLMALYVNDATSFDDQLPVFESVLTRVRLPHR